MPARLLLADDSVTIQRVIELTFADEDVEVIAVGDGDAAIARLDRDPPDVVLADVGMPGRDGYAVAAHVKATPALAHIPVLLLAGAFEPVDDARVAETGCAGVLVKPFEPQMVISRVRALLAERRTLPTLAPVKASSAGPGPDRAATPPEPAGAASAPSAPAARNQAVDDYFERLDAAFASLNAQTDEPATAPSASPRAPAVSMPAATSAPVLPPPSEPAAAVPLTMAEAFDALLGVEQGGPVPVLPGAWSPVVTDDLVEQVARRIAEQVGDRIVRDLAPRIVTDIAERLVREEIARIRAEADAH